MLVATIREYPWTANRMWAIVWDVWSQDGMHTRSQMCWLFNDKAVADREVKRSHYTEFPNHAPRIVEVVNGSENRLLIDAETVSLCTVKELFTGDVYCKETMAAVHGECERVYSLRMQATGMTESVAP